MALAPFIRKASLSAVGVLTGISADEFEKLISGVSVAVEFDGSASDTFEGTTALELTVNLLARLYPRIILKANRASRAFSDRLAAMALSINPALDLDEHGNPEAAIIFGNANAPGLEKKIFVGSDSWISKISTHKPQSFGASSIPFGPAGAACLAAANLFRMVFARFLENAQVDSDLWFDFRDYSIGQERDSGEEHIRLNDIGLVRFVGIGAIGNATVWTLARSGVSGCLHLIDDETVDDTNPQRYVLATIGTKGTYKTEMAKQALDGSRLNGVSFNTNWAGYLAQTHEWQIPVVAVAVDTAQARCEIQGSLPASILNSWTQPGDLGVSRHEFLGNQACLCCLYLPTGARPSLEELVAGAINYKGNIHELRNMLFYNRPLTSEWLDRIAADMGCERAKFDPFLNKSILDFYNKGICGGIVLSNQGVRIQVPMAFQSAMAGIMLAAEIVKLRRLSNPDVVTTKLNLLRPLGKYVNERENKKANCICQDGDYISRYRQKYTRI
jgi:hypothetical protein